jgi:hypothetical protein
MPSSLFTRDLKVARAHEHIAAVKQLAEDWLDTDAYTIDREVDAETGYTVCKARIKGVPPEGIGLAVGDAVHNLRSALDHTVYLLAQRHHGESLPLDVQESLMFPIIGNQNSKGQPTDGASIFEDIARRRGLDVWLPENVLRYIKSIQPYHWKGDDFRFHWLWLVHDLDRLDKHRSIHVTTGWLASTVVSTPGDPTSHDIGFVHGHAPVQDGDVLLTFSGAEVGVEPHFSRAVALNEGPAKGQEVGGLLDLLAGRVRVWVGSLRGEIIGPVWDS